MILQGVSADKAKKAQDLLEEAGATISLVMS
jgi:ribosomal protein L7/L12